MASSDFAKCPRGHSLPYKGLEGDCTPLRCGSAESRPEKPRQAKKVAEVRAPLRGDAAPPESEAGTAHALAKVEETEERRIAVAAKSREKWMTFLGTPQGLSGDEAEKYADQKLAALLVDAVAVVERNVKFGSPEQQERAANKILDANGKGKREAANVSAPPIVINLNTGNLPWRKEQSVEGEVVEAGKLPPKP